MTVQLHSAGELAGVDTVVIGRRIEHAHLAGGELRADLVDAEVVSAEKQAFLHHLGLDLEGWT